MYRLALAALILSLSACTRDGARFNADGTTDHQAVIGYPASWSLAESRAAEVCPAGYDVLSKLENGEVRELWYRCK